MSPIFGISFGNMKIVKKCKNVKYHEKICIKLYATIDKLPKNFLRNNNKIFAHNSKIHQLKN